MMEAETASEALSLFFFLNEAIKMSNMRLNLIKYKNLLVLFLYHVGILQSIVVNRNFIPQIWRIPHVDSLR
jgi:hypothetical protein